ncbi:MAG: UxaA family hydrolase [Chloroflexi bacterium]|nr:UxaA family hydrolase [Chloroflexota bacterium]MBC7255960.1 UxaA family hydrolase [Chloroflexota bacterium]
MINALRIHPKDTVVVALTDLAPGTEVEIEGGLEPPVVTVQAIPFGHKVAIVPIKRGEQVIKYGASIGVAVEDIAPGEHVHTHNLKSIRGRAQ